MLHGRVAGLIGMSNYRLQYALACGHGVADFAAGWMLMSLAAGPGATDAAAAFLLYNGLAFGGQVACASAVDGGRRQVLGAALGLGLIATGVLVMPFALWLAVAMAGSGSALFHVAGGALALLRTPGRVAAPAVFTAPGATGLAIGGWLGTMMTPAGPLLVLALVGLAVWIAGHYAVTPEAGLVRADLLQRNGVPSRRAIGYEPLLVLLLFAVSVRSAVWTAVQYGPSLTGGDLVALGLCASLGKAIGGILPDRVGWLRWTLVSCTASVLLFALGSSHLTLLPAVVLLQSTVPVALATAGQLLPGRPGLASGLVLGLAVTIGALGVGAASVLENTPRPLLVGVVLVTAGVIMNRTRRVEPDSRRSSALPLLSLFIMVLVTTTGLSADIVGPGPVGGGTSAGLLGTLAAIAGGIGVAVLAWLRRRRK